MPGLTLSGLGLLDIVFGFVHAQTAGFAAPSTIASLAATLAMYFGMFGAIFFPSQYLQLVLGNSALQAGLKLLLWTGSVMIVSPISGVRSARRSSRGFLVAGLSLRAAALAWIAITASTTTSYSTVVVPFVLGGSGMALVLAPAASAILGVVRPDQAGQASGAANAIREVGGVFGVAILASVFAGAGRYATGPAFVTGLIPPCGWPCSAPPRLSSPLFRGVRRPRRRPRSRNR